MRKLILTILCLLIPTACFATEQYDFANTFIDGLWTIDENIKNAQDLDKREYEDPYAGFTDMMTEARMAISRMEDVQKRLEPYTKSKNELISDTAASAAVIYKMLIVNKSKYLTYIEKTVKTPPSDGETAIEMSKIDAEAQQIGSQLVNCSVLMTHCLVDQNPDEKGLLSYLAITSKERNELKEKLITGFGDRIKEGIDANKERQRACGALIYQVLSQPYKTADERKK